MQHAQEPWQIAADVFFIECQFLDGFRGGLEEGCIACALMSSDKSPDLLGYGEGNHEVMSGKLSLYLLHQPLMCFMMLAVGTVPVAA